MAASAELAWAYFKGKHFGDSQANLLRTRNRLVLEHKGLVRTIAHRMKRNCTVPYADLEQIGFIGLTKAVERYDPTQGIAFSSFAVPYIRGEMLHFLRDRGTIGKVPRRWRELHAKIRTAEQAFAAAYKRPPSTAEIALSTKLSELRVIEVQQAIAHQHPLEFKPEACTLATLEPEMHIAPTFTTLQQRISKLSEADQRLLKAVYFERQSRKVTAKLFHLSASALKLRLRTILAAIA